MAMNPLRALGAIMIIALVFSAPAVLLAEEDEGASVTIYQVQFHHAGGTTVTHADKDSNFQVSAPNVWVGCWTYEKVEASEDGVYYVDPAIVWHPTDTITKSTHIYAVYPPFEYGAPPAPESTVAVSDYLLWGLGALVALLGIAVALVWFKH